MVTVTVTVHWRDGDEDYEFENEDSARWFMADALRKCGSVKVTYKCKTMYVPEPQHPFAVGVQPDPVFPVDEKKGQG